LAVTTTEVATPDALVVAVFTPPANVMLAPEPGGAKVTVAFGTAFPPASVTVATRGLVNAVFSDALCPLPLLTTIFAAAPAVLVSEKLAVVAVPDEATILKAPLIELAVRAADVANPEEFVTAVFTPPAKVTLAPVWAGAWNVTVAPETGLLPASVTNATSALP
jgi:hypothetical protein